MGGLCPFAVETLKVSYMELFKINTHVTEQSKNPQGKALQVGEPVRNCEAAVASSSEVFPLFTVFQT